MNRKTKPNMNGNLFQLLLLLLLLLLLTSTSGTISPQSLSLVTYTIQIRTHTLTFTQTYKLLLLLRKLFCSNRLSAFRTRGYWLRLLYNHMQHFLRLAPLLLLLEVATVVVVFVATSCNQSSAFLGEAST